MKSKISVILLLVAMVFVGCEKPEVVKPALNTPNASIEQKSYNSLTFSWEKVTDAIEYVYSLTNASKEVIDEGTTTQTSVTFSGLLPNTAYTLNVCAVPALESDYTTSQTFSITGTTDPLEKVGSPSPTATQSGTKVAVSWEAIQVASSYTYTISGPGLDAKTEETTETEVEFTGLEAGIYSFSIVANCTTDGYETASEATTITFEYIPPKRWRAKGTITYEYYTANKEFPGILAYDDQTQIYTIEGWCGVSGADINFMITDDGIQIVGIDSNEGYYAIPTGLESPSYVNVYTAGGYSTFEGDKDSGEIWLGNYDPDYTTWDYIGFTWEAATSHPTIDDICGSYLYYNWGYEYYTEWGDWKTFDYQKQSCTITKTDDNTVYISTLLSYPGFEECGITATYDPETLTLTVPVQEYATYYTVGLENNDYTTGSAPEEGIVAKVAGDGSISMSDWVVYYNWDGWWYKYFAYTGSYWYPESAQNN